MPQTHQKSFLIILSLIFLFPLFFIPGGALSLEVAKSALLVLGVILATLVFLFETWRTGNVSIPRHFFLMAAIILPAVYLLSALLSTPSSLGLFGYNLEIGTFGYMLLGAALLTLSSMVLKDTARSLQALAALFLSLALVALFAAVKIIFSAWIGEAGEDILILGNFFGNMGSPIGNWTDLAMISGLLALLSVLTLGMIPLKLGIRALLYGVFVLSTALLLIINFSTALVLTLIGSVLLLLYFLKMESHFLFHSKGERGVTGEMGERREFAKPTILPLILGVLALLFLINPTVSSDKKLGPVVSETFKVANTDVRPSFSATLSISKAVLSQASLLGSGPNTFGEDWLIYKPVNINATPFWATAFPFGAGFIPTQIATTGILGTVLWLAFFAALVTLAVKALSRLPESRAERFTLMAALLMSVFIWAASVLYAPSGTVLMLAFISSGIFLAALTAAGIVPVRSINYREAPQTRLVMPLAGILVVLGALWIGWIGFEKTASAYYFKKAVDISTTEGASLLDVENELIKGLRFAPSDIHYVGLARVNFLKAQAAANAQTGTAEENQALFQDSLRRAIEAARTAVGINPAGYGNWVTLGTIYSSLVPEPLKVEGAYENAQFAYSEALRRNPNNPELPLLLARLELNKGDADRARSYIRNSIALKEDYADAYIMLAQLEVAAGNTRAAIQSAEALTIISPNNPGLYFELGLLKYSNDDFTGARAAFTKALELSPNYANAKYYLALTLAELGEKGQARMHLEELLISNPGNADLEAAIEKLSDN